MFVVRRYWNMVSIYIYIFAVTHICIYAYYCVYICILCVCGHALYSGILERLRLHFAEAFGPSRFGGKMFVRSRFPMAFSQMNDRLLEMERKLEQEGFVDSGMLSNCLLDTLRKFGFILFKFRVSSHFFHTTK